MKFVFALALLVAFVAFISANETSKAPSTTVAPTVTTVAAPVNASTRQGVPANDVLSSTGSNAGRAGSVTVKNNSENLKSLSFVALASLALIASRLF